MKNLGGREKNMGGRKNLSGREKNVGDWERRRAVLETGLGVVVLAAASALAAAGQAAGATDPGPRILVSFPGLEPVPGEIVREIDDPHTGDRWLLMRDPSHPGGPGRLVLAESAGNQARQRQAGAELSQVELRPVIRAGERLIVEENTPVVEARLEAVALGPAVVGSPLDVRLRIGGRVVRAVALAPGRAAFQPESEARP
jgi:hypothetical protein